MCCHAIKHGTILSVSKSSQMMCRELCKFIKGAIQMKKLVHVFCLVALVLFSVSSLCLARADNGVLEVYANEFSIGNIHKGMDISEVISIYGNPDEDKPLYNAFLMLLGHKYSWQKNYDMTVRTGKLGEYEMNYNEPGIGEKTVYHVTLGSLYMGDDVNKNISTAAGIHLRSTEAEVQSAYGFTAPHVVNAKSGMTHYILLNGTNYMDITLKNGRVMTIEMGFNDGSYNKYL